MLSTNTFVFDGAATAAMALMSAMDSSGLVGVSTMISLVFGVIAARTASRSASDTAV